MALTSVTRDVRPLVRAAQAGDAAAYGTLVEHWWPEMVRFARSIVGDKDAEDIVQEGLVAGWREISALREPSSARAWIFSIVFRRSLRWKRWRRIYASLVDAPVPVVASDPGAAIDVGGLLRRLTPAQRAVLHLTVIEGMTDAEIAEVLRTAPGTVRAQRRRARERLACLIRGYRHA
jgi:RNA polymerase sigma-70 factor (ECF subfamily)